MARPSDPNAKIDLLRAAEAEFVERGLDDARVEEITARAGRSKGSFYLHFASKEDAFRQIVETLLARLAQCLDAIPPFENLETPVDLDGHFERWLDSDCQIFDYMWQNRGVCKLLLEGGKSSQFGYLIDEFAERARNMTRGALQWGVKHGIYRADLDIDIASLVIAGAYDRVARELVRLPRKPDVRQWLRGVQRLVLRGVCSETGLTLLGATRSGVDGVVDPPVINSTARERGGGRGVRLRTTRSR